MKKLLILVAVLVILVPGWMQPAVSAPLPPRPAVETAGNDPARQAVLDALQERMITARSIRLVKYDVETQAYSDDFTWASLWMIPVNPQTGEPLPTEPGLAFARREGETWDAILPAGGGFQDALLNAPEEIISPTVRTTWLEMNTTSAQPAPTAPITGYMLPWEQGKTVYLSRSTAHDADFPSKNAHYSFDFYVPRTMFNIHAARGGRVWLFNDTVANGNPDAPNYIVLEDTSTSPTTYQLYMHLAQNSIPPALKQVGALVTQGQFIGIADDTGMSTGHHLHFQVETAPYWSYWGKSVDITFADVDINGGRPRVTNDFAYCTQPGDVCQTARSAYISGNLVHDDVNAPWGDLYTPDSGLVLTGPALSISGWASDDQSGIASVRLKANYLDTWEYIGSPQTTSPYFFTWDLCSSQVPDGPVSIAVEIQDKDGNLAAGLPGLRHFIKDYACPPPPTCNPGSGQVALYSGSDFQGSCNILGSGGYNAASFASVGDNNTVSVRLGSNALVTLFDGANQTGRAETLTSGDANLQDNAIGAANISSVRVFSNTTAPAVPVPVSPLNNETISDAPLPTVYLHWEDTGAATSYRLRLDGIDRGSQTANTYPVNGAAAGTHTWQVRAVNSNGSSDWSALQTFTVNPASYPAAATITAPYTDDFESFASYTLWARGKNWDQSTFSNRTPGGGVGWSYEVQIDDSPAPGYDNGFPHSGDLTSPPIHLPAPGYTLTFWYRYETENPGRHWDQRRVQISMDGGDFVDLLQLGDDPPNFWLQSPAIDLSAYSGHTVRVRFSFATLDAQANNLAGWYLDDVSITQMVLPSCPSGGEPDSTPAQAQPIQFGDTLTRQVCPSDDVDYYTFTATAGDQVGAALQAVQAVQPDTTLTLLDGDGKSVLAYNDDRNPGVSTDSWLSYRFQRSGTYYLKVKAWDYPSSGGPDYNYTLALHRINGARPSAVLASPPGSTFLPNGSLNLQVQDQGQGSEISHVTFYWHSGDWQFGGWNQLGMDWNGADGWSYPFTTTSLPDQQDIAIYARAYDWAGNWTGSPAWNLWLDRTAPVTSMIALPSTQAATAIPLQWNGSDNLSGLDRVDIQVSTGGAWSDWSTGIAASPNIAWFIAPPGQTYSFRLRGLDRVGNAESYPTSAEATTSVPAFVCTSGDAYENDNNAASATTIAGASTIQTHTFCNPVAGSGWLNDQDWYRFNLGAGQRVMILVSPLDAASAARLELFAADGVTPLVQSAAESFGGFVNLEWTATQLTEVLLKVTHLDGRVAGDDVAYQIWTRSGIPLVLPWISK